MLGWLKDSLRNHLNSRFYFAYSGPRRVDMGVPARTFVAWAFSFENWIAGASWSHARAPVVWGHAARGVFKYRMRMALSRAHAFFPFKSPTAPAFESAHVDPLAGARSL